MKILRAIICISVAIGLATGAVMWPVSQSECSIAEARKHKANGVRLFQRKAFEEAVKEFDQACLLDPTNCSYFQCRAYAYIQLARYKQALKDFDRQIDLYPGVIAYSDRADLRAQLKDWKGALADYNHALQVNQNRADLLYERGLIFQRLGNHKAAYEDFDQSIRLDNKMALSYMGRGISEFHLSQTGDAYADCSRAAQLGGQSVWYQCIQSGIPVPIELRGCMRANFGDHCGAVSDFTDAINHNSKNKEAYCGRGAAWSSLRNNKAAVDDYTKAIKLDPKFALAYRRRAYSQEWLRNEKAANSDYETACRLEPNCSWEFCKKGLRRLDEQDFSAALKFFNRAIELNPSYLEALKGRAKVYYLGMHDTAKAFREIDNAICLNPNANDNDAYFFRGVLESARRNRYRALNDFNKAIEIEPSAAALRHRGMLLYYEFRETDKALDDLNEAICRSPKWSSAYLGRAMIKKGLRDYQGALQDANFAVATDSKDSFCYASRAHIRYHAGDLRGAMNDYNTALKLKPNDDDSRLRRALLRYKNGNVSGCLNDFAKITDWWHVDIPI